jgi:hypothetical protein
LDIKRGKQNGKEKVRREIYDRELQKKRTLSYFFVSLVFMVLVSGISKAGQTINIYDSTIDEIIAGNGESGNNGKAPFNKDDLRGNTLNIGEGVSVLNNNRYICGAYTSVSSTVFSNNVLNINEAIKVEDNVTIKLFSCLCLKDASFSNATNNMINIADGVSIRSASSVILRGASVAGRVVNSNKTNISPNIKIYANTNIGIYGAVVYNGVNNVQMFKNAINISENVFLKAGRINIIAVEGQDNDDDSVSLYSTENIVSIHKNVVLEAPEINILGTRITTDTHSIERINNNTLNFHANRGYNVKRVGNFINYNFYLYEGIKANSKVLSFASGESTRAYAENESLNLEDVHIDIEMTKEKGIAEELELKGKKQDTLKVITKVIKNLNGYKITNNSEITLELVKEERERYLVVRKRDIMPALPEETVPISLSS